MIVDPRAEELPGMGAGIEPNRSLGLVPSGAA
jgi:hypothetical protein